MMPLIAGGDLLSEDWNDMVDDINQDLGDEKDWVEAMGMFSKNLPERITTGWSIEGYAQYRMNKRLGLRGTVGHLIGMTSTFGHHALDYWDD